MKDKAVITRMERNEIDEFRRNRTGASRAMNKEKNRNRLHMVYQDRSDADLEERMGQVRKIAKLMLPIWIGAGILGVCFVSGLIYLIWKLALSL